MANKRNAGVSDNTYADGYWEFVVKVYERVGDDPHAWPLVYKCDVMRMRYAQEICDDWEANNPHSQWHYSIHAYPLTPTKEMC